MSTSFPIAMPDPTPPYDDAGNPILSPESTSDVDQLILAVVLLNLKIADRIRDVDSNVIGTQWAVLNSLIHHGPMRPFTLAKKLNMSRQHVFQATGKLKRVGYVTSISQSGSRAVILSVTPEGRTVYNSITENLTDLAYLKCAHASPKNIAMTAEILTQMTSAYSSQYPDDQPGQKQDQVAG